MEKSYILKVLKWALLGLETTVREWCRINITCIYIYINSLTTYGKPIFQSKVLTICMRL